MAAHSKIGASSMSRWSACPGSVRLCADIPSVSSAYAEEGTLAHEHAAYFLENWGWRADITDEMREAVKVYANAIVDEVAAGEHHPDNLMLVEQKLDLSSLHPGMFGTADCIIYHGATKVLQTWDYKHGQGIAVEVENNEQLLFYATGALLQTKVPCEWVEMVIVQPRCPHPDGPVRRWRIPAVDLLDFSADLVDFARATEDPNAPLVAGDHCRFCPAAATCPCLHRTAIEVAKAEFSPTLSYDPEVLSKTLHSLPVLEAFVKNVREFAYAEAEHGRTPPGWKLVEKRATRKWKGGVEANDLVNALGIGFNDVMEEKLKSPAQVEKILGKKHAELLTPFTVKESSGLALVPEEDKRQPAKASALADFTVVTDN